MKYNIVRMKRSAFDTLTSDEQCLFIVCCHFVHRTQILTRAIAASSAGEGCEFTQSAAGCQTSLLMRIHAGFLFEAWCTLKKLYFNSPMEATWDDRLPADGQRAAASIKQYFRHHSPVGELRNQYGFHTDIATVKKGIDLFSKDDDLDVLVPTESGPLLCPVAEYMTIGALPGFLEDHGHPDFGNWVERELAGRVTVDLTTFCGNMAACIAKTAGTELLEENIDITLSKKTDLNLPFFVDLGRPLV